ncbi:TetR/AcrR family transcriptional regulator, partial [Nocardia gipuzkoensis]|uniref:TetR/AcrR family transcriptional regulator n=1 Tax=Nocardia gipuzkoensis TaxID=2749991 RepID=UPI002454B6A2
MISDQATHPDRRGRRKAKTTEAILDAGERLFLTQGFQATTVEQLATEADVAVGTLYGHFGGKEGVYAALIDRALELDARYCDEAWDRAHDPVGRLLAIADGYLRFAREHPGYFRLFRFPPEVGPGPGPPGVAPPRQAGRVGAVKHRMTGGVGGAI